MTTAVILSIVSVLCVKTAELECWSLSAGVTDPLLLPCDADVRGCWEKAESRLPPRVHVCVHTAKMVSFLGLFS